MNRSTACFVLIDGERRRMSLSGREEDIDALRGSDPCIELVPRPHVHCAPLVQQSYDEKAAKKAKAQQAAADARAARSPTRKKNSKTKGDS